VQPFIDSAELDRLAARVGSSTGTASHSTDFTALLEERIALIEVSFRSPGADRWRTAVSTLASAARVAGALRVEETALKLLDPTMQDSRTGIALIGQLRSDARVFSLAHSSLRQEQALADELASRRPA